MAIALELHKSDEMERGTQSAPHTQHERQPQDHSATNLAALLDAFTDSLANPDRATVGSFAGTVQALHGELAFLARNFRDDGDAAAEAIDFDAIFPANGETQALELDPAFHGVMASDELEHLCLTLSR